MSEQYLSAFAIDGDALLRTVGSADEDAAEEVEWLLGELLPAWPAGALERGRGLLLLRDGGK
ncbi:hypothetical protein ACFP3U_02030 [Kitasatospora misakiensis]|uniref:Uncharacterized protein n=1 Tax=Kitasatospora misakiensis TaxID=67330 RepID=A0ABW0WW56_9ACTN